MGKLEGCLSGKYMHKDRGGKDMLTDDKPYRASKSPDQVVLRHLT